SGVAETGLGAVTCARHTFFMPQGCVNYWKGERIMTSSYAYTDYAIACVMSLLMDEGAESIGVFYDIYCQWHKHFWTRAPKILLPEGELQMPVRFFGGVPKYHLAAHIDSCYAVYSLNNMQGIGRLDAEGCEHAWSSLNQASGSTSEKGPGARIDSLNFCMNDWNWHKFTSMISLLLTKYDAAQKMAVEQENAWLVFHNSLAPSLTTQWASMSINPFQVNGKWTSVFLTNTTTASSRIRTVLDLNRQESARIMQESSTEPGFTAPTWISEGIDIERLQNRLVDDITAYGDSITPRQSVDLYNRRTSLTKCITYHRSSSAMFMDIMLEDTGEPESLSEETQGQPEYAALYLPSHLKDRVVKTERSLCVMQLEITLRCAECMETLCRLRTGLSQKAQMLEGKKKNARREIANTCAQTMIQRLSLRITQAMADYNRSYRALRNLGVSDAACRPFIMLEKKHLNGLTSILLGKRDLQEGTRRLPWFWSVRDTDVSNEQEAEEQELAE
ncbi:hypothetical protein FRC11_012549, partial [Ceratobasidium sp. 423]